MNENATETSEATFRLVPVASLTPQPGNPRKRNDAGFQALVESITEFGIANGGTCSLQPIVVNSHPDFKNQIVGGEQRWRATQEAGYGLIWIREVELDAQQMRELTVRLNVPAGEWDWDVLADQFSGKQLMLMGFEDLEFSSVEPEDDIALEGVDATVGEAKKEVKRKAAEVPVMESMTRQYLLFFVNEDYQEFISIVELLKKRYGQSIASEAVLQGMRELAQLEAEGGGGE